MIKVSKIRRVAELNGIVLGFEVPHVGVRILYTGMANLVTASYLEVVNDAPVTFGRS